MGTATDMVTDMGIIKRIDRKFIRGTPLSGVAKMILSMKKSTSKQLLFVLTNNTHLGNMINIVNQNHFDAGDAVIHVILACRSREEDVALRNEVDNYAASNHQLVRCHSFWGGGGGRTLWNILFLKFGILFKMMPDSYDTVFISNYTHYIQHQIVKHVKYHNIILLHDGVLTLHINELRKSGKVFDGRSTSKHLMKLFPPPRIEKLTFYTPFSFKTHNEDAVVPFSYGGVLKKRHGREAHFIGSPLVQNKMIDQDYFDRLIGLLSAKFDNLIYIAHPKELDHTLAKIRNYVEVIRFDKNYEEQLAESDELPHTIVSFFSSVLLNLFSVYEDVSFVSILLPVEQYQTAQMGKDEQIVKLYKYIASISSPNFQVVAAESLEVEKL